MAKITINRGNGGVRQKALSDLFITTVGGSSDVFQTFLESFNTKKFVAIYPFYGTNKLINLIDPDSFELTVTGSPTDVEKGIRWNGSTDWAETGIRWDLITTSPELGMSYFLQDEVLQFFMGSDVQCRVYHKDSFGNSYVNISGISPAIPVSGDVAGFHFFQRKSDGTGEYYKDGVLIGSETIAHAGTSEGYIYLNKSGALQQSTTHTTSLAAVHLELTAGEITDYTNAVNALMAALGRDIV